MKTVFIYLFILLLMGYWKHQLSHLENVGSFTGCENMLVFPGWCLRKSDSGQCLCFDNLATLSMTRLVFRWHQNRWLWCSQWPGGHRPFLQLHCAVVLQTEGGSNCCQHGIYDSHHRFTSAAKAALIWSSHGFLSTHSIIQGRLSGLEASSALMHSWRSKNWSSFLV